MIRLPIFLISMILLLVLSACAGQPAEPTLKEAPPPTKIPPPTSTPLLPEEAEVVRAFLEAFSEDRFDEVFSYLTDDVRLKYDACYSGKDAHKVTMTLMEDTIDEWTAHGVNYDVTDDQVSFILRIYIDGNSILTYPTTYVMRDGMIQYDTACKR